MTIICLMINQWYRTTDASVDYVLSMNIICLMINQWYRTTDASVDYVP